MLVYVKRKHYELVQNVKPHYKQEIIFFWGGGLIIYSMEREDLTMLDVICSLVSYQ